MDERRRVSQRQEKRVAKKTGARLHAGSGSGNRRHDMHTSDDLIECKTTLRGKKQITIKDDDLRSVEKHALAQGRDPRLYIELGGNGYVILPEDDYEELKWKAEYDGPRAPG